MSTTPPLDLPHLLHEALSQLGWNCNPEQLAQRVNRLHVGLPREDEFSVVCSWLGRCALIHKLDQAQSPLANEGTYQVPDLLAVFREGSKLVPVLIEVKSSTDSTLSFKPDYRSRLKAYAELLSLPLLIAWKFHGAYPGSHPAADHS